MNSVVAIAEVGLRSSGVTIDHIEESEYECVNCLR